MPRKARNAPGGLIYHVLNRAAGRSQIFRHDADYDAFEKIIYQAQERHPLRILSFCVMPTHWHFVAWPRKDGDLTDFFRWLTHTHAMRWRVSHNTVGDGPLYQGRFKAFPIQEDSHLLTVCRYVERNPLASDKVRRAQDWRRSSLWIRLNGTPQQRSILSPWPIDIPRNWTATVNDPLHETELSAIKSSLARGRPFGDDRWTQRTSQHLHLDHTLRNSGRPKTTENPRKSDKQS